MRIIVVPVDTAEPAVTVELDDDQWYAQLKGHLSEDSAEHCVYDRDSYMWVGGESTLREPVNSRVTAYVRGENADPAARSEASRRGQFRPGDGYALHGPVVITGAEDGDSLADVPDRMRRIFGL